MPTDTTPTAELLESHMGWMRELARHLVSDATRADDLTQEACLVALERPPRDSATFKRWAASVLRNLVREKHRGDERRRAREVLAAHEEALDATDRLVERAATQRELVDAVIALDEPYRTAILRRFFDEEPPRETARKMGVSVATVQSRITRGLQLLRERLDRKNGGRDAWLALFVPLCARTDASWTLTLGTVVVNTKLALTAASILVAATIAALSLLGGDDHAPAPAQDLASAALVEHASANDLSSPLTSSARSASSALPEALHAAPTASATNPAATPASIVRGRVYGTDGVALPGIEVGASTKNADAPRARSGPGGWFECTAVASAQQFVSLDPAWATVRAGSYRTDSKNTPIVIVGHALRIAGEVVDPRGTPISGVSINLVLPRGFEARFTESLESTHVLGWSTASDADGRFMLDVPHIDDAIVRAVADGFQIARIPTPVQSDLALVIRMARAEAPASGSVRGRVVSEHGEPVARARVALGLTSVPTDERGEFAIALSRAVTADRLTAVKAGFRPVTLARPQEPRAEESGWPDFVELRLGGPALTIAGRVVDAEGKPRAGLRVWLADPTHFGLVGRVPIPLEGLMANARMPPQILESEPPPDAEDADNFMDQIHRAGPATAFWNWSSTNDDGEFEIRGLDDRAYRLRVMDDKTLVTFTSEPIHAGDTSAKVTMPAPLVHARVAGRVVTERGTPVPGVSVLLARMAYSTRTRVFGGTAFYGVVQPRERVVTDDEGRFEFKDVPRVADDTREGLGFQFMSERIVPLERELESDDAVDALEIVVHMRCSVEVRLEAPHTRADRIGFQDEGGQKLDVLVISDGHNNAYTQVDLVDGRSGVVSVSSAARTLLLWKGDEIVERVPIELSPSTPNVIEP
ncbi:MAG: sigma-70 family RNA polymerase sigma factor [Planctomycetota bacterium]